MNEFYDNNSEYEISRISKQTARKLFEQKKASDIYMLPCNMRPGNPWTQFGSNLECCSENYERTFNSCLACFEAYQCTPETGNYTSFYRVVMKNEPALSK